MNINPSAVAQFQMDNFEVSFNARFGGQPMRVVVPIGAVLAIYARENGEGTVFTPEDFSEYEEPPITQVEEEQKKGDNDEPEKKRGSHLKVIK